MGFAVEYPVTAYKAFYITVRTGKGEEEDRKFEEELREKLKDYKYRFDHKHV